MSERDPRIMAEFKERRTRQLLASIPVIALIVIAAVSGDEGMALFGLPQPLVAAVLAAVVLAVVVFSLVNWRCPACSRYLGKSFNPRFCPGCGAQLRD